MINHIKSLLITESSKDTLIVSAGTIINISAGGLFFILAPRILGPANYGIFSTVIATGLMAASIANFGIDTGILKFAKLGSKEFDKLLSLAFKSYIFLGFLVALLGIIFSPIISKFLGQPQIVNILRIAFVGNMFVLLTNFYVAALQAKREFAKASIVNISSNVSRIILLGISAYFFVIGLFYLTVIFFAVTIISVIIGKLLLSFKFEKSSKREILDFHKYNFWIAASLIISTIPFDNYFLLKLAGPVQTGIYAAPFKILTFAHQFGGNFTRVLASRFSSFDTSQKAKAYALKAMIPVAIFITGLIVIIAISDPLVNILFGKQFKESVIIFRILAVGFIFFFASTIPSSIILYYLGKSKIAFNITLIRYVAFILLLTVLIIDHKAVGAAIAFTASEIIAFSLMTFYSVVKLKAVQNSRN